MLSGTALRVAKALDWLRGESDRLVDDLLSNAEVQVSTELPDESYGIIGLPFKMKTSQQSDRSHRSKAVSCTSVPSFLVVSDEVPRLLFLPLHEGF